MVNRAQMRARAGWRLVVVALAAFALAVGTAQATHLTIDTEAHDTIEQRVDGGDPDTGYQELGLTPGEPYIVRDGAFEANPSIATAQSGRETRRVSLAYLSQLTDFQLADEESPARVEFADQGAGSAWRPWEALNPFIVDASIRQINEFADASTVAQGDGSFNAMDLALVTGDQADNQQRNEMVWVRELLEGNGPLNFNAGLTNAADYANPPSLGASCAAFVAQEGGAAGAAAEGAAYTGVQDYDDYPVAGNTYFYDPDNPQGDWLTDGWPTYTGLMDKAQTLSFTPEGLDVPFYVTNGNHDVLVQGNEDANAAFEGIATGCFKALGSTATPPGGSADGGPDPNLLFFPAAGGMLIPPDPQRQFVSKPQVKQIFAANDPEAHGFAFVDPAQDAASNGSASYYAWDPPQVPGFRFVSIDTNSEGGQTAEGVASGSSNGNIDDPQFQWLKAELDQAQADNKLIVLFGHHPVRSLNTPIADEQASPCTTNDSHGHDVNPGCDLDPRISEPLHFGDGPSPGQTFVSLLSEYPNVIAYVPGHTHEHRITPFARPDGTTWWELNTSATADNPNQSRLLEVFDNHDGTLSIFTSVIDHASDSTAPAAGNASGFNANQLASIGRTFEYNDPQSGTPSGEGEPKDRNAELLLDDPRDGVPNPPGGEPTPGAGAPGLVLELDAKKKQNAKKIKVFATCLQAACEVTLGGRARAPGDKAKLKKQTISLQAGETEKVALRARGRDERSELERALKGEGGKARIKGKATTAAGAEDREKLKVRLKG
jgi:hypothetical protein